MTKQHARGVPSRPRVVDFGDKTWGDVRATLAKWAWWKYPRAVPDHLEDAIQDAILDGISYWQTLDSSHTGDPQKNFDFAVYRCKHALSRALVERIREHTSMPPGGVSKDDLVPGRTLLGQAALSPLEFHRAFEQEAFDENSFLVWDRAEDPEDDIQSRARVMLQDMSNEELEEFFTLFGDATQAEIAERLGIADRTVRRRKAAKRTELQHRARRYGIA